MSKRALEKARSRFRFSAVLARLDMSIECTCLPILYISIDRFGWQAKDEAIVA
jgi:hypothetical protein